MANSAAVLSGVVAAFFLAPFLVARLGATVYGTWAIVGSLTAYIALLDLGMRGAVTLLVARHHAAGHHEAASGAVSAALWFRQGIAVLVLAGAVPIALAMDYIIEAPPGVLAEARWALLISAVTVIVTLLGGVFGGVVVALNRYDVVSLAAITQTALRVTGAVLVVRAGYSLTALALVDLASTIAAEAFTTMACLRLYPALRVSLHRPDTALIKTLTTFSGSLVLAQVFGRVMTYSQSLIIGMLLSVGAVTLFAIANALVEAVRQIVFTITPVFTPLASRLDATGARASMQRLVETGTRLVLIVAMPMLVTMYVRGETFIGLWMGQEYAANAGEVLRILVLGMFVTAATSPPNTIVLGLRQLRPVVVWGGVQALATIALSVLLIKPYGLAGVAWAATVPAVIIRSLVWPRLVCRLVGLPLGRYLAASWGKPVLGAVPFAVASYIVDHQWPAQSLTGFALQVLALLHLYAATILVVMWSDVKAGWRLVGVRRQRSAAVSGSRSLSLAQE